MKRLIIVRHGEHSEGKLTKYGIEQICRLGIKLKREVISDGERVTILTSTARRALESSAILKEILGAQTTMHAVLWSDACHTQDLPRALELVRSRKEDVDVLILVTHFEYALEFPYFFGIEEYRKIFPRVLVNTGDAISIDCITKEVVHITSY